MPGSRDLRFDTLRGLLLLFMTVNHLPTSLRYFTDGSLGLFSSAEGFVFISGILAGFIYIRRLWKGGEPALREAALKRTKSIYAWHIASFIGCWIVVQATEKILGFCAQSSPQLFYSHPLLALGLGITLLHQPGLLDLLPMYCVFVMLLPMVLPALEAGRRWLVITCSVAIWFAGQFCPPIDGAPIYPVHVGTFNLLSWQLLFVMGMVIGHARSRGTAGSVPFRPWLLALAAGVFGWCFMIRHYDWPVPWSDTVYGVMLNKPGLGALRLADFASCAYIVAVIGRYFPSWVTWRPLAYLGQSSIAVVAAQSVAVMFVLQFPGPLENKVVNDAVVVAIVGVLYLAAWLHHRYQRQVKAASVHPIDSRQLAAAPLDRAA